MTIKDFSRRILVALHLDLTKNLHYDRLTERIMALHLRRDSNCVDVGCHKGEILERMLHYSPEGRHYAFEPLPGMYRSLQERYGTRACIFPYALAEVSGSRVTFNVVANAPAYSGLRQRAYDDLPEAKVEQIEVEVRRLDEVVPEGVRVDFIKIDVEGGDYNVLKGASRIILECRPLVVFEFGLGGADRYGVSPHDLYDLVAGRYGYGLYTLDDYVRRRPPLTEERLTRLYGEGREYYFVAAPK